MARKFIIIGFFIASMLLTILVVYGVSTYKKPIEVHIENYKIKIDNSEAEELGYLVVPDKDIYRKYATKTTRTKKLLGWDTRVDTLTPITYVYGKN